MRTPGMKPPAKPSGRSETDALRLIGIVEPSSWAERLDRALGKSGGRVIDLTQMVRDDAWRVRTAVSVILVGLDGGAPNEDLREDPRALLGRLHRRMAPIPIIAIADDSKLRVLALRSFADDAATEDVTGQELLARIAAVLRRKSAGEAVRAERVNPTSTDSLTVDSNLGIAMLGSKVARLTPRQVEVLSILARHSAENPVTLDRLHAALYDGDTGRASPETVRVLIRQLNRRLEDQLAGQVRIANAYAAGYFLEEVA